MILPLPSAWACRVKLYKKADSEGAVSPSCQSDVEVRSQSELSQISYILTPPLSALFSLVFLPLCWCQYSQPGAGQFPGGVGGPPGVDSVDDLVDAIPGLPGEDYPIYSTVNTETLTNIQSQQIFLTGPRHLL